MGLGKTLTVISLILKQIEVSDARDEESEDDTDDEQEEGTGEWRSTGRKDLKDGGEYWEELFGIVLNFIFLPSQEISSFVQRRS